MAKQLVVKQDEEKPVTKEVLAKSIADIGIAMRHLRATGLNRTAILVLVKHRTNVPMGTIDAVIESLENLKRDYCS